MTAREIMKYIESEYHVINHTPCELCGGEFHAEEVEIALIDDMPYDVLVCVCENCGNERTFEFSAPFIEDKKTRKKKVFLN